MSTRFYDNVAASWKRLWADHGITVVYKTKTYKAQIVTTAEVIDMTEMFAEEGTRTITTLKEYFTTIPAVSEKLTYNGVERKIQDVKGGDDLNSPIIRIVLESLNRK